MVIKFRICEQPHIGCVINTLRPISSVRRRNLKATIIQNRENHQVIMLVILAENHFEELIVQDYH